MQKYGWMIWNAWDTQDGVIGEEAYDFNVYLHKSYAERVLSECPKMDVKDGLIRNCSYHLVPVFIRDNE